MTKYILIFFQNSVQQTHFASVNILSPTVLSHSKYMLKFKNKSMNPNSYMIMFKFKKFNFNTLRFFTTGQKGLKKWSKWRPMVTVFSGDNSDGLRHLLNFSTFLKQNALASLPLVMPQIGSQSLMSAGHLILKTLFYNYDLLSPPKKGKIGIPQNCNRSQIFDELPKNIIILTNCLKHRNFDKKYRYILRNDLRKIDLMRRIRVSVLVILESWHGS